jgi:hypothetical protein
LLITSVCSGGHAGPLVQLPDVAEDAGGGGGAQEAGRGKTGQAGDTKESAGEEVYETKLAESECALEKIEAAATGDGGECGKVSLNEGNQTETIERACSILKNDGNCTENEQIYVQYVRNGLSNV